MFNSRTPQFKMEKVSFIAVNHTWTLGLTIVELSVDASLFHSILKSLDLWFSNGWEVVLTIELSFYFFLYSWWWLIDKRYFYQSKNKILFTLWCAPHQKLCFFCIYFRMFSEKVWSLGWDALVFGNEIVFCLDYATQLIWRRPSMYRAHLWGDSSEIVLLWI